MRVVEIEVLPNYRLRLKYADGVEGIVDLSDYVGKGVFAVWEDPRELARVKVGSSGELVWNDQVDLDPDALYLRLTGKKPEDIFPKLRELMPYDGD